MDKYDRSLGKCPKWDKLMYESESDAKKVAKNFRKAHGPRLKQYECWDCGKWHNGHQRKIINPIGYFRKV